MDSTKSATVRKPRPPPEIKLHEPPVDFIDNKLQFHHRAFANVPSHFDKARDQYIADPRDGMVFPAIENQVSVDCDILYSNALEQLKNTTKERSILANSPFGIRDKKNWDEVYAVVKAAEKHYLEDAGTIRKAVRKVAERGSMASPYLLCVPGGNYTTIITGGCKMVIDAAIRNNKLKESLQDVQKNLQDNLGYAYAYINMHADEEEIKDAIVQLFVTLLEVFEETVRYYTDKPTKHATSILKGNDYEKVLEEKIRDIDKKVDTLMKKATIQDQLQQTKILKQVSLQNHMLYSFRSWCMQSEWNRELERKRSQREMRKQQKKTTRLIAQLNETQEELARSRQSSPVPFESYISTQGLKKILRRSGPDLAAEDMQQCVHAGNKMKMAEQDRAAWVMQSDQTLQRWLTSGDSATLLVQGNHYSAPVSPMSYLCAMLVQSLEPLGLAQTLSFFCGRHISARGPLGSALGLIQSFIAQLLTNKSTRFDLSFLTQEHVDELKAHINNPHYLKQLCNLFEHLFLQLDKRTVVFCIIDGIGFWDLPELAGGLCQVIYMLTELGRPDYGGHKPMLKLLVTTSTTTKRPELKSLFGGEIVTVPTVVSKSGLGFTGKQMARHVYPGPDAIELAEDRIDGFSSNDDEED